jgi:hypothetical protein
MLHLRTVCSLFQTPQVLDKLKTCTPAQLHGPHHSLLVTGTWTNWRCAKLLTSILHWCMKASRFTLALLYMPSLRCSYREVMLQPRQVPIGSIHTLAQQGVRGRRWQDKWWLVLHSWCDGANRAEEVRACCMAHFINVSCMRLMI